MVKVVIVNGKPGCGKTAFETLCKEYCLKNTIVHAISTVDFVKECAKKVGWDGKKTPEGRRFLSDLKAALALYNDSPFKIVTKQLNKLKTDTKLHIVFVDSREPGEINRFKKEYCATTVLIKRPNTDIKFSNFSDDNVFDFNYDYIIENDGDMKQLTESAETLVNELVEGARLWKIG